MKIKVSPKDIFLPTIVLFLVCLIVTALLAGTNMITKDTIAEQQRLKTATLCAQVLPSATDFEELPLEDGSTYYQGASDGTTAGYVFTTESKGYGGTIQVLTGIDNDGNVTGVAILSHNETPGLGANATKDSYLDQYQQAGPDNGFSVIKSGEKADGQIDAITGATITSRAVTDAVNVALDLFKNVKGGN